MNAHRMGRLSLECRQGDIADQADVTAVVNAANAELQSGGGVAGALHRAAGPGLARECRPLAPIEPGQAVITSGHDLPNRYVIHALGPVYGRDQPSAELLVACYRNILQLAEEHEIDSMALPALSTGAFGFPMAEAARLAFRTIREEAPNLQSLKLLRFVLFKDEDRRLHEECLEEVNKR